ncbi:hypothetical protein U9M48_026131 [Paspalum notatum var. saurae]|uniref:Uncharacterized protein n=1 Tax=Paspalum notatum var. saurae TaxID=547442 RepID=A0AAQ3TQA5_PASNO
MAPAFGRSISFPLSPARSSSSSSSSSKAAARHVRSISLPSSTRAAHPLLAHLHATVHAARAWAAATDPAPTPSTGLAHLHALHAALAELLLLPEPRAALRRAPAFDCLLDGFLALADAHGAFQEALVDLCRHAADAQAALRRRDAPRLASAARAQRRAEKDLARLASSARAAARLPQHHQHLLLSGSASASAAEVEVCAVLAEAVAAVAAASAAVFSAVECVSSAATAAAASVNGSSKKPAAAASLMMSLVTIRSKGAAAAAASSDEDKEMAALHKLQRLEQCVAEMEAAGSDKVFRSILHTRNSASFQEAMAPTFGRSISFPLSPARSSKHVRSTSLPSCRAPHPLLAHLRTQAAAARAWSSTSATATPASGLARIAELQVALADLLRLPEPQAAVRASASDGRLLHAFLLLADAHQGFQEALLALRAGAADARAAIRRRDAAALAAAARSRRRTEKEIGRIAADVARCARQIGSGGAAAAAADKETEMAAALADAAAASAAASAAVFSAVAAMSAAAATASGSSKKSAVFAAAFALAKAAPETADVAPEKLEELERCIDECESGSEMVFRSIVQTRLFVTAKLGSCFLGLGVDSESLPSPASRPAAARPRPLMAAGHHHVRSASVPCHSHPLLADVDGQLLALRAWTANPGQNALSLAHVRALLCVLDELLHLPLAQGALMARSAAADSLLDGFLVLADAFGSFLAALLALRQHAADLRAALRRRDAAKLASAARALRLAGGKELDHLAAALARDAARCARAGGLLASTSTTCAAAPPAEVEVARAVAEAVNDTAVASAAVFLEVGAVADAAAALASPASCSPKPKKSRLPSLVVNASGASRSRRPVSEQRREAAALEKLQELEQCVAEVESESEKVFRSLVQTRVSLLNIHTPTF